jgi:hypothetical protein
MKGKTAKVTYDPSVTDEKKLIDAFNKIGGQYTAKKSG